MTSLSRGGGMLVRLATAGAICLSIVGLSLAAGAAVGTAAPLPSGAERAKGDDSTNNDPKAKGSFWDRFRVAQVDQGKTTSNSSVEESAEEFQKKPKPVQLEEVVVTGSRIPVKANEGAQELKVYTRQQIERSGQTTTAGF